MGVLAACRRKTSEVSKGIFAGIITGIIQPIWRQIRLLKLPKSSRITLSDRLLEGSKEQEVRGKGNASAVMDRVFTGLTKTVLLFVSCLLLPATCFLLPAPQL
jgi:hypothetical protein